MIGAVAAEGDEERGLRRDTIVMTVGVSAMIVHQATGRYGENGDRKGERKGEKEGNERTITLLMRHYRRQLHHLITRDQAKVEVGMTRTTRDTEIENARNPAEFQIHEGTIIHLA